MTTDLPLLSETIIAAHYATAGDLIIMVLAAVLVAIAGALATRPSRTTWRRSSDIKTLAGRLNFDSFKEDVNREFALEWGFLSRLDQGTDRYAFNLLRGKYHEDALFVFDYHYEIGDGKNSKDYYSTVLMLICDEVFPKLTIRPERVFDKIAGAFGLENEIKFESAEFSKLFNVRSPEKKFAYDVCNARMIEYLLSNRDLQIDIEGPAILLSFEPLLPAATIEFNLQRLAQIRSLLPEYLFDGG